MGEQGGWGWRMLALLASAWLLVFALTRILGPLNPDEIYFSHMLWLTLQGKRAFLDFYSQHLPAYFALYDALIPRGARSDLSFIWFVRLSNLIVLAAYGGLLFAVMRKGAVYFVPLLLMMIIVSRMIEVRGDTLGLLAFNAAWVILLVGRSRTTVAVATVLAILAACFSARALPMGVGFGLALLWRAWLERDPKSLIVPLVLLGCAIGALLAASLTYPRYIELIVQSVFLGPTDLLSRLSLAQRIFAFDRLPQTLLALVAMMLAVVCLVKGEQRERAGVVVAACGFQLLLIFLDPSPFPYVYAWAVIPSLAGIALAESLVKIDASKFAAAVGTTCASGMALAIIFYPIVTGHAAPTASNYRLLPDPPLASASIERLSLDQLVSLMLSREQQQSLSNQLLVREELCRRIRGTVLSAWQSHPICAPDATYYWFSVKWPNINAAGPPPKPAPWFGAIFSERPPDLFIWQIPGPPVRLNPWALSLLKGYEVEAGFAVRSDLSMSSSKTKSSDTAATQPNNGRR